MKTSWFAALIVSILVGFYIWIYGYGFYRTHVKTEITNTGVDVCVYVWHNGGIIYSDHYYDQPPEKVAGIKATFPAKVDSAIAQYKRTKKILEQ